MPPTRSDLIWIMPAEGVVENTTIILTGGGPGPAPANLPQATFVIAADSGLHLAAGLDLTVDLIVGDLDSARPDLVAEAEAAGTAVARHPVAKDATDLELALEAALTQLPTRIVVVGGGGGRLDHLLGLAQLLADERWAACDVQWHTADAVVYRIDGHRALSTEAGDLISLLPATDTAVVSISGTRWELHEELLHRGSTRGMSNEATGSVVTIAVATGVVLTVHGERRQ